MRHRLNLLEAFVFHGCDLFIIKDFGVNIVQLLKGHISSTFEV
jgi:hypothetical protein